MYTVIKELNYENQEECLLIGVFQDVEGFGDWLKNFDEKLQEELVTLQKAGDISGKLKHVAVIPTLGLVGVKRFLFVGLGKKANVSKDELREAFGKAFKKVQQLKLATVSVHLDTFTTDTISQQDAAYLLGEACRMATYRFAGYKTKKKKVENTLQAITVYSSGDAAEVKDSLKIGDLYGKATNSARTLVNTPPNLLKATDIANYTRELAERYGFAVDILHKADLERLGMGAILAVNQGSSEEPRLIVLKYQGKAEWDDVIGLVGKGITYDTGGYSIKTKTGMVGMKSDMAGAAAVLGAMEIIGAMKPEQNVLAVIPATDNMISGSAFKPDDVITTLSGKTVEVLNSDAEGRLVLADAITYAKELGADILIDAATLTGGVITALGTDKTGAFTNHQGLYEQFLARSRKTGEMIWLLPLTEKDREKVRDSKIADLNNSPTREGHAIMGAAFIGEFAEETPWIHLDIAGTATTRADHDLGPAGATGVMVRTLADFVLHFQPLAEER